MSSASSTHPNHSHDHSSHSHHHSHSPAAGGKKAPCDYCSAIKAHGAARKAEQRAAEHIAKKKQKQKQAQHEDCSSCEDEHSHDEGEGEEDEEEEYDDPDDPDKLVLPAQRVALPLDTRILTAITVGFVLISLKMVKNILAAKYA